jgi:hypothetical protein
MSSSRPDLPGPFAGSITIVSSRGTREGEPLTPDVADGERDRVVAGEAGTGGDRRRSRSAAAGGGCQGRREQRTDAAGSEPAAPGAP